jgi:hypothetical protein
MRETIQKCASLLVRPIGVHLWLFFFCPVRHATGRSAGGSGPSTGVRGQTLVFTLTANDPDAGDNASGFTFAVNWGAGSPVQSVSPGPPGGSTVRHPYAASGRYTVTVTATDSSGLAGPGATPGR